MTQREVYQLFIEWFDSVGFVGMTDMEKDWIWLGFSVGYCHDNNKAMLAALQQLLEIYDDNSGKVWTTSSKRRALDNARSAVNKALGGNKMKLIDLLVQELPKRGGWPQNALSITQDNDGSLCVWDTNDPHYEGFSWKHHTGNSLMHFWCEEADMPLSSDHKESIVTYWQYKAALAASQKPAWNGEGLPPVGCECECHVDEGIIHCVVVGYDFDGKAVVMRNVTARKYFSIQANSGRIKPLRTEAERKRNAAAKEMARHANDDEHRKFDAGLRNCLSIYDAIAAGKIPGVKLED